MQVHFPAPFATTKSAFGEILTFSMLLICGIKLLSKFPRTIGQTHRPDPLRAAGSVFSRILPSNHRLQFSM
jgi:hypothetical protein